MDKKPHPVPFEDLVGTPIGRRDVAMLRHLSNHPAGLQFKSIAVGRFAEYEGSGFVTLSAVRGGPLRQTQAGVFWAKITQEGKTYVDGYQSTGPSVTNNGK